MSTEIEYPEKLLRGIASPDYIRGESVLYSAFQFDNTGRTDGYEEASINWSDNDLALQSLLEQKKKDNADYQFKVGVAVLVRKWVDELAKRPNINNNLKYERAEIDGNPFHGNLLQKVGLDRLTKITIAASIAMCVEKVEYRQISDSVD
jgi:hypothetical protein